jgi:hypothetical protein
MIHLMTIRNSYRYLFENLLNKAIAYGPHNGQDLTGGKLNWFKDQGSY